MAGGGTSTPEDATTTGPPNNAMSTRGAAGCPDDDPAASALQTLLDKGSAVELKGLTKGGLKGQRGTVTRMQFPDDDGRWPVSLASDPARVLLVKPANLVLLRECAQCGALKPPADFQRCKRCMLALYCDRGCQAQHWKGGGHRRVCKAPWDCIVCLDSEDLPLPIESGCGCRGDSAWSHVACRIEEADSGFERALQSPAAAQVMAAMGTNMEEAGAKMKLLGVNHRLQCSTCKQKFHGAMALGIAKEYVQRPVANFATLMAAGNRCDPRRMRHAPLAGLLDLAGALDDCFRQSEGEVLHRILLAADSHSDVDGASMHQLGVSVHFQGRPLEAEAIFRKVLAQRQRILGPDHADTLRTAERLFSSLFNQQIAAKDDEAHLLLTGVIALRDRTFGPDHRDYDTLVTSSNLARMLLRLGKQDEVVALSRSNLNDTRRLLGSVAWRPPRPWAKCGWHLSLY